VSLDSDKPHFKVSPAVLGPLGVEQLQDPALAILELIKNSWDADARSVKVVVDQRSAVGKIVVRDDGHGMNAKEFRDRWLVIGQSYKRTEQTSEAGRPLIGEKGLGRLASFALGNAISVESAREPRDGFVADVNWGELSRAPSLEDYEVKIVPAKAKKGTRVAIGELKGEWSQSHTEFLATHAEFLASVPGQRFSISLRVNGKHQRIEDATDTIDRLAEGFIEMKVAADGEPQITVCLVKGVDEKAIAFRSMRVSDRDRRLAGMRLQLKFFRRDAAARRLGRTLKRNEVRGVLERYQGIRMFRDGINVPPYGLNRDDWAGLEKQRTSTGGPTLVPGNSQLIGELHLSRREHSHLVVTAGRSGFADQAAVRALATYVRWTVRELGTARRAQYLGITSADVEVPGRIDDGNARTTRSLKRTIRAALTEMLQASAIATDPALASQLKQVSTSIKQVFNRDEEMLRLYAQLASSGIAATSFAHELRADFDVVSDAVDELGRMRKKPDKELLELLNWSWGRIRTFASLFKVLPVKVRRSSSTITTSDLRKSVTAILKMAPPDKVATELRVPALTLDVVPAELDSILLNLTSNAVKAIADSDNRDKGQLRVVFHARGADLELRVADNGCGIAPKVSKVMFEPLEGTFSEGTGMGLPIVKYIAERYGGAVTVASPAADGFATEIVVTLRKVVG
jgi:signal transduction histidine kinase